MYMSLFSTCGWVLRLGVAIALLVSIHPALALLAVFALPAAQDRLQREERVRLRATGAPRDTTTPSTSPIASDVRRRPEPTTTCVEAQAT